MSLFGAARLYVVCATRIERDFAPSDSGSVLPRRDGAWAVWAKIGAFGGEVDPLPPMWRVQPGPVRVAHRRTARA